MPFEFLEKPISDSSIILNSIKSDYNVYKWFLFLVKNPSIEFRLKKLSGTSSPYLLILIMTSLQAFLFIILFMGSVNIYVSERYDLLWFLPALVLAEAYIFFIKRDNVVKLAAALLKNDLVPAEIGHKTLYQISEDYSKKLSIASLVDTIYASENALRTTLKISCFWGACILFLDSWKCLIFIVLNLVSIYLFVNSILFYKRLR